MSGNLPCPGHARMARQTGSEDGYRWTLRPLSWHWLGVCHRSHSRLCFPSFLPFQCIELRVITRVYLLYSREKSGNIAAMDRNPANSSLTYVYSIHL